MMIDLHDQNQIHALDPKHVLESTNMLASQCEYIWELGKELTIPAPSNQITSLLICGMGGSAYGGHIVTHLLKDTLPFPVAIVSDYTLPSFADEHTLVILTSYSGSTEEVLSCAKHAIQQKCPIIGLTSGGALQVLLKENHFPCLQFETHFNPCGQPRLGTGYIIVGTLAILAKAGYIPLSDKDMYHAIDTLQKMQGTIKEEAINLAPNLYDKIPVFFAAEFLSGNAHIIRNQCNETAKSFSAYAFLSELNHHLLEGLKNPPDAKLHIVCMTSKLYSMPIQQRMQLTQDVIDKNNVGQSAYAAKGDDHLTQMLTTLSFGGYLTLFLSLLYEQDPSIIPWVDYFKEQLATKKTTF